MGGDESAGPAKPPAARVELVRKDGHWTLPDSYGAPAADAKVQALARYAVDAHTVAEREDDPQRAIDTIFDLLTTGWGDYGAVSAGS